MLIDAGTTIAYKCPSCGSFEFIYASLFTHYNGKTGPISCRCGKSSIFVSSVSGCFNIVIPCIGCGNTHEFMISRKDLLHREINVFNCPVTGFPQCFTGRDDAVRKMVDHLEKELDELIDTFGYDRYFKNSRVMLDSLNKIHDLAEQGNLHCECGSTQIELVLLSDKIQLRCAKCSATKIINAASNYDLKEILTRQQIMLLDDYNTRDAGNGDTLVRKTDGK